jgi:hypothetical protein
MCRGVVSAIVESFVIKQKFALRLHDEIHCNHSCIHDGIPGLNLMDRYVGPNASIRLRRAARDSTTDTRGPDASAPLDALTEPGRQYYRWATWDTWTCRSASHDQEEASSLAMPGQRAALFHHTHTRRHPHGAKRRAVLERVKRHG